MGWAKHFWVGVLEIIKASKSRSKAGGGSVNEVGALGVLKDLLEGGLMVSQATWCMSQYHVALDKEVGGLWDDYAWTRVPSVDDEGLTKAVVMRDR
jgi:hypothetical protein